MNEKELMELFEGLKSNNLLSQYTHLLTGYIGNELFLRNIAEIVKSLREVNPNLIYGTNSCFLSSTLTMYVISH